MKKIISNPIFTFILGALICGTTGVVASTLMASNVSYTPKDSTWGVNNVEAAIDSLKLSKTSDNYSTEEQVIGTWIDGKPLYQKVYTGVSPAVGNTPVTVELNLPENFENVVNSWGWVKGGNSTGNYTYPIGGISAANNEQIATWIRASKGKIAIQFRSTSSSNAQSNKDYYLVFQYTKTTD